MSARSRWLLLLLLAVPLAAEEVPVLDPLPPVPATEPQLPSAADDDTQGDPDARLAERIERDVRELELAIADFMRQRDGRLPRHSVDLVPQLAEERSRRDEAWQRLREALRSGAEDGDQYDRVDILDRPPADREVVDEQVLALRVQNRLHMAQCHYRLLDDDRSEVDHARAGQALLADIDPEVLPATLRPEWYYLQVAFAVERARASAEPQRRREHLAEAERYLAEFVAAMPDHIRVAGARLLLEEFALDRRVDAVKEEARL